MFYKDNPEKAYSIFNENNFSIGIVNYIKRQTIITSNVIKNNYKALVEVGCGKAENFEIAHKVGVKYIGVEQVFEYVKEGNKKYSELGALVINDLAENIDKVLVTNNVIEPLLIYPFNCIGNMHDLISVIKSLIISEQDFIVFSYLTNKLANQQRFEYYSSCGIGEVYYQSDKNGIRIKSSNGLNSIAYYENYLLSLLNNNNSKKCKCYKFSNIGVFYSNINLDKLAGINKLFFE